MISKSQLMQWETEIAHKDAIIADLRTRLAAAEKVVEAARNVYKSYGDPGDLDDMRNALAAYDQQVEGNK